MLTIVIKEIDFVIQDEKLPIIITTGCIGAACFNAIQFNQSTGLTYELRALQWIVVASGFLVCSEIKNKSMKGQYSRKVWGFGSLVLALLIGASKIFLLP